MRNFPVFFALAGKTVLIAGGGEAASRKARLVVDAGAKVAFVNPGFDPGLLAEWTGRAAFRNGAVSPTDFTAAALAFVAVEDDAEAARIAAIAREAGVPVNAVDRPHLSDFITPSIVDRGDVVVAISTGGDAPVLGRRIREKIEALLPQNLSALSSFARSFRSAVSAMVAPAERRGFWERFFDGPIAARVLAGDEAGAREAMIADLNRAEPVAQTGVVHIVGAGPGDPELLTLKALHILQDADVIVYDRLVSKEILDLARRDAVRLYVGKAKADHAVPQSEIEARLIAFAREGKRVVRLKGGDPFVFGRGGEELDAVRVAGIAVFVTPGVTAATGCAAAASMPLTHRDLSQAVTFVTGHAKEDGEPDVDWEALARLGHTLVVYMGVGRAEAIGARLIAAGRAAATPVAIIEKGTTREQKVIKADLRRLGEAVRDGGVEGPALLVIGEVAARADGVDLKSIIEQARRAA